MCERSDWVFIGKVAEKSSFFDSSPANHIASVLAIDVEVVIHGEPTKQVLLKVPGGSVDGKRQATEGFPSGDLGTRYLLLLRVDAFELARRRAEGASAGGATAPSAAPGVTDARVDDGLAIVKWWALDADAPLPDAADAQAVWEEHCGVGVAEGQNVRPTERFLPWIPASLLDWCEHY